MGKSRKGLWTGLASGAMTGAATGSAVGGVGAVPGGVLGAITGGISGSMDDADTEYERAQLEDEKRRRDMESGFSHLMTLRNAKQEDRSQGMAGLGLLASQRESAEVNGRRRMLRVALLGG